MRRPLLLVHDPAFGGMGHGARFLLDACADARIAVDALQLTTPGRGEDAQGRLGGSAARHATSLYARFLWQLLTRRPSLVYVPVSQWGLPLARDLLLVTTAAALRVPVVVHLHGSQLVERVSSPSDAADRIARRILRPRRWAVLSEALRIRLIDSGAATDVRVLRNPSYPVVSESAPVPSNGLRLGFLGVCCTQKGLDILCEAIRQARRDGREVRLTVAGAVSDYPPPPEPWLDYLGKLDRLQLESRFWPNVDTLVLPTRWQEGQPFVVLEALERGKRVLVTETPGLRELTEADVVSVITAEPSALAQSFVEESALEIERRQTAWFRTREAFDPVRVRTDWLTGLGLQEGPIPDARDTSSNSEGSGSGR